ncbi:MAG TPA: hypothetical protein VID07_06150 [Actinomycetes bacterium]|jgi:hypothetical protein
MTRRAALATAGAITIVLLAAAAAIAANLGLLRVATDTGSAGGLVATELAPTVSAQQPAGDPEAVPTGDASGAQAQEPSDDSSADVRSGVEPGDNHRSSGSQLQDEPYAGRGDDD